MKREICGLLASRSKSGLTKRLRLFCATDRGSIADITREVAERTGRKVDPDGCLVVRGCGMCPLANVMYEYEAALDVPQYSIPYRWL